MNYYPHHIGDFDKATRHLTRIERSIYRDLLDVYYDTEGPLTTDMRELCRKVIARDQDERDAVEQVLKEFFTLTDAGWFHERCEEEIAAYQRKRELASGAGRASAQRRANKKASADEQPSNGNRTDVERTLNGRATNQNQNQNQNQEPEKPQGAGAPAGSADVVVSKPRKPKAPPWEAIAVMDLPDWLPRKTWTDWVQHRVAVNAPMTERAAELSLQKLARFRAEGHDPVAIIDASVMSGKWTDLYAPKPDARASPPPGMSPREAENARRKAGFLARIRGRQDDENTIDMETIDATH